MKLKLEIESCNWILISNPEIESLNWNLNWNLKLKLELFWPYGAIFCIEVRFKNIFGTHLCRLYIFVLEVQPYLFVFISAKFWAFLHFLGSTVIFFFDLLGLFLESRSGSKIFLEPSNVDYKFLFWKYSPIFLFFIGPILGLFCTFWALRGYFWSWGQVQKLFWDLLT